MDAPGLIVINETAVTFANYELGQKYLIRKHGGYLITTSAIPFTSIITYTTTNGQILSNFNNVDKFGDGLILISNTYKDGVGTAEFAGKVYKIGSSAFDGCATLSSIVIPNTVIGFGECAFYNCSSLSSITIPNSVTIIGNYAFCECSSLSSFTGTHTGISSDNRCIGINGELRVFAPYGLTSYTIPNIYTRIGNYAFYSCRSLSSVTIPNSVTSIGNSAFDSCISLSSVTCESITPPSLGSSVFNNTNDCPIYVPSGSVDAYKAATNWSTYANRIQAIQQLNNKILYTSTNGSAVTPYTAGTSVFGANIVSNTYNDGVGVITFDAPVTKIGKYAFYQRGTISTMELPLSVNNIGQYAFQYCSGLTSINLPDSITFMGYNAFCDCSLLDNVVLPSALTTTEQGVLARTNISSISIPSSLTNIGEAFAYNCHNLRSVTFPNTLTSISKGMFYGCNVLTSVTIPSSCTSIQQIAFSGCTSLTSVTCKSTTPPSLGSGVFDNTNDCPIYVPSGSVDTYKAATNWSNYASRIQAKPVPTDKILYTSTNGSTVTPHAAGTSIFGANIVSNTYNDGVGIIKFDAAVTKIGNDAFSGCSSLNSITIPNGVTVLGEAPFRYCSNLSSIVIPSSVNSVGVAVFFGCYSLSAINGTYSGISEDHRCLLSGTTLNSFAPYGLTSYTIPSGITVIGRSAFERYQNIRTIIIPDGVTSIGDLTFYKCYGLSEITMPSTVKTVGGGAFMLSGLREANIDAEIIGSGTTDGSGCAFKQCTSLTSVTFGSNVELIGFDCFRECSALPTVTIPANVRTIQKNAFALCGSLATVYCEAITPPEMTGNSVFYGNAANRKIYVPAQSVDAYKTATN